MDREYKPLQWKIEQQEPQIIIYIDILTKGWGSNAKDSPHGRNNQKRNRDIQIQMKNKVALPNFLKIGIFKYQKF